MSEKTSKVLTGSTGSAWADAPPRVLVGGFACGLVTALCIALNADAALTGALVTTAGSGASLAWIVFDAVIRDRL